MAATAMSAAEAAAVSAEASESAEASAEAGAESAEAGSESAEAAASSAPAEVAAPSAAEEAAEAALAMSAGDAAMASAAADERRSANLARGLASLDQAVRATVATGRRKRKLSAKGHPGRSGLRSEDLSRTRAQKKSKQDARAKPAASAPESVVGQRAPSARGSTPLNSLARSVGMTRCDLSTIGGHVNRMRAIALFCFFLSAVPAVPWNEARAEVAACAVEAAFGQGTVVGLSCSVRGAIVRLRSAHPLPQIWGARQRIHFEQLVRGRCESHSGIVPLAVAFAVMGFPARVCELLEAMRSSSGRALFTVAELRRSVAGAVPPNAWETIARAGLASLLRGPGRLRGARIFLIDLCSGVGGAALGVAAACLALGRRLTKVVGVEIDEKLAEAYPILLKEVGRAKDARCLCADVLEMTARELIAELGTVSRDDILFVHASPCCRDIAAVNPNGDREKGMRLAAWCVELLQRLLAEGKERGLVVLGSFENTVDALRLKVPR